MKDFQGGMPGRLRVLPVGAKLLYSAFAAATLVGLLVSARLYGAAVGDAGPAAYYAGAVATATAVPTATAAPAEGPAIELAPDDAQRRPIVEQIPERKLLEVTHFHLFTIPIYVLVLAHLWLLAKIPGWLQNAGVVAAVVTSGLHMAAPWLVRGKPGAAFLMGSSAAAMLLTLGVLAVVSVVDMWLPSPKPPPVGDMLAELRRKRTAEGRGPPATAG